MLTFRIQAARKAESESSRCWQWSFIRLFVRIVWQLDSRIGVIDKDRYFKSYHYEQQYQFYHKVLFSSKYSVESVGIIINSVSVRRIVNAGYILWSFENDASKILNLRKYIIYHYISNYIGKQCISILSPTPFSGRSHSNFNP